MSPLAVWAVIMVGIGSAFLVVTGIYAVTVWPVVLLIAWVCEGRRAGPAEPGAEAVRDRDKSEE